MGGLSIPATVQLALAPGSSGTPLSESIGESFALTVRPIPDLETTGISNIEVAVLPHYRYAVAGAGVSQTIGDNPMVWLMREFTRGSGKAVIRNLAQ